MMKDDIFRLFYHLWENRKKEVSGAKLSAAFYERISPQDREVFIEAVEELQRKGIVYVYQGNMYEQYGLPDVELTSYGFQYMIAEWR